MINTTNTINMNTNQTIDYSQIQGYERLMKAKNAVKELLNQSRESKTTEHREPTYQETTQKWLRNERFSDFHTIGLNWNHGLIVGYPQAGKSSIAFAIALTHIINNKAVIMVLRDSTKDAIQIKSKALRFAREHRSRMLESNYIDHKSLNIALASEISSRYVKGQPQRELRNYENILSSLTDSKKLIIAMSNGHQLQYLNRLMDEHISEDYSDFVLITDEADMIGYSEIKTQKQPKYHAAFEYNKLFERASQVYEISATVFDVLAGNKHLLNTNIVIIRPPPTYKGIRDGIQFFSLEDDVKGWQNGKSVFVDTNIRAVYNIISEEEPFQQARYSCPSTHPIIVLHKTMRWHSHHDSFFNEFRGDTTLHNIWTVIVEDGRGFKIYSQILRGETITIGRETISSDIGEFHFRSRALDIQEVLQYFHDNGGADRFSHIVIKAGDSAGRSRSYISSNGNWHLTHMYYVPSKTESVPNMIQACRLNHDRPDSVPLKMYAPRKVIENLRKGDLLQEEQIHRLQVHKTTISTFTQVRNEIWTNEKVPRARICHSRQNREYKALKVEGDDGGWNVEEYKEAISTIQDMGGERTNINRGNDLRLVIEKSIGANSIMRRLYDMAVNEILNIGSNMWITRATIVHAILQDINREEHSSSEATIQGHLRSIYQTKCSLNEVTDTTKGFLMKKENDTIYFRIN